MLKFAKLRTELVSSCDDNGVEIREHLIKNNKIAKLERMLGVMSIVQEKMHARGDIACSCCNSLNTLIQAVDEEKNEVAARLYGFKFLLM